MKLEFTKEQLAEMCKVDPLCTCENEGTCPYCMYEME